MKLVRREEKMPLFKQGNSFGKVIKLFTQRVVSEDKEVWVKSILMQPIYTNSYQWIYYEGISFVVRRVILKLLIAKAKKKHGKFEYIISRFKVWTPASSQQYRLYE